MQSTISRIWLGVVLIILGGLFLMDNFGLFWFDLRPVIFSWHSILLIIGIIVLVNHKNSLAGYILIAIGLLGTMKHTIPYFFDFDFSDIWPIMILLVGVWLIFKRNGRHHHERQYEHWMNFDSMDFQKNRHRTEFTGADYVKIDCVFNTIRRVVNTDNFKGGNISTVFGEVRLDLTNSKLAPEECTLEVSTIFGGINIRVPSDWKVQLNVSSVFGGFDDKRYNISSTPQQGVLIINGSTVFGGGKLIN